jgi:hypothetical protein
VRFGGYIYACYFSEKRKKFSINKNKTQIYFFVFLKRNTPQKKEKEPGLCSISYGMTKKTIPFS